MSHRKKELTVLLEVLMRSRFSAFVVGDEDHIFRSWHPRTRPPGPYCCILYKIHQKLIHTQRFLLLTQFPTV